MFFLKINGQNQDDEDLLFFNRTGIHEKLTVSRIAAVDDNTEQLGDLRRSNNQIIIYIICFRITKIFKKL